MIHARRGAAPAEGRGCKEEGIERDEERVRTSWRYSEDVEEWRIAREGPALSVCCFAFRCYSEIVANHRGCTTSQSPPPPAPAPVPTLTFLIAGDGSGLFSSSWKPVLLRISRGSLTRLPQDLLLMKTKEHLIFSLATPPTRSPLSPTSPVLLREPVVFFRLRHLLSLLFRLTLFLGERFFRLSFFPFPYRLSACPLLSSIFHSGTKVCCPRQNIGMRARTLCILRINEISSYFDCIPYAEILSEGRKG